jgi:hypothetical protein
MYWKSSQWEASISNRKFYLRVVSDAELKFAKKGDSSYNVLQLEVIDRRKELFVGYIVTCILEKK